MGVLLATVLLRHLIIYLWNVHCLLAGSLLLVVYCCELLRALFPIPTPLVAATVLSELTYELGCSLSVFRSVARA